MLDLKTLLWLVNNYRLWLIAPSMYKGPAKVFHEYAEWRYGNKVSSAAQMFAAQEYADKLAAKETDKWLDFKSCNDPEYKRLVKRFCDRVRAESWRPRSWKRKGW